MELGVYKSNYKNVKQFTFQLWIYVHTEDNKVN